MSKEPIDPPLPESAAPAPNPGAGARFRAGLSALLGSHLRVFWINVLAQTGRNLNQAWTSQAMTLATVSLSVLIFSFFYLVYFNMNNAAAHLGHDLRLVVYLGQEPDMASKEQLRHKIQEFEQVKAIEFVSSAAAYDRFAAQLDNDTEILADMPRDFLPPSIEVYPHHSINMLAKMKPFADYLHKLPGVVKVRYGQEWIDRFFSFMQLLRVVVLLSGLLLILTSIFMVATTIRLTILGRQAELEVLRLLGASNGYIRVPFFLEGMLQGFFGSIIGLLTLFLLYAWTKNHFSGPEMLRLFEFSFFPMGLLLAIVLFSILLCTIGSFSSIRKFLRV